MVGSGTARLSLPVEIVETRLLVIVRGLVCDQVCVVADALLAAGVSALEVTLNSPGALETIGVLGERFGAELVVGAGTVCTVEEVGRSVEAGARFVVCPNVDVGVIAEARRCGVPSLPGALTASEALSAWHAGASAVKLFPAELLGPGYLRALRGPLDQIDFVPTGGVTDANAGEWLAAGAVALGVGSWLVGDSSTLTVAERARSLLAAVRRE